MDVETSGSTSEATGVRRTTLHKAAVVTGDARRFVKPLMLSPGSPLLLSANRADAKNNQVTNMLHVAEYWTKTHK